MHSSSLDNATLAPSQVRSLLRGTDARRVAARPQIDTQSVFKQDSRVQVWPRGPVQDGANGGLVDAAQLGNSSCGTLTHGLAQGQSELAGDLSGGIVGRHMRPTVTTVGGRSAQRPTHEPSLRRTTPHLRLLTSPRDNGITSSHDGFTHHPRGRVRWTVDELIVSHRGRIPAAYWDHIGPFVLAVIKDLDMPTTRKAKNYFTAVTAHVLWCWQTLGMALDREQIFQVDVIARFIDGACGHYADSTRASYRGRLVNVSKALVKVSGRVLVPRTIPAPTNASPPYSPFEVDQIEFWARNQNTQYRTVNALVLIALGFGAGLLPAEILALKASDVLVDDQGVVINVQGRRPRSVPMTRRWEGIIADLAKAALRPDMFMFCPKRLVEDNSALVSQFITNGRDMPVRVVPHRMRSTWIVGHLSARVPTEILLEASGMSTPGGLARFAVFVPPLPEADTRAILRAHSDYPSDVK